MILFVAGFSLASGHEVAPAHAQDSEQSLEDRIRSKVEAGQIDAALDQARLAVGKYPNSSTLYQLLGAALFKKGLNEDARTAFRRAVELDPSVPQNYYNLALVNLSDKQYARAVGPLETFLRLDPNNAEAHLLLGRAYHNLNRTGSAIEQFKKALTLAPQLPLAHYHLGYAYQSQGNQKSALDEFKKEIELNPNFYDSYWLAGNIELERGKFEAAEDFYGKGIRLKPEGFQAHYGMGRARLAKKQVAAAETELRRALELKPDDVEAHYALARAYQQMGDKELARREFAVCAQINARRQNVSSGIAGRQQ